MPSGQEIIVSPFKVYLGDIGAAYPDVDGDPISAVWGLLGDGGDKSEGEDGLVITHNQTIDKHMTGGRTGAVKATRSAEDLMVSFDLVDMTLEVYAKALNDAAISDIAAAQGIAGVKSIGLHQGRDVVEFGLAHSRGCLTLSCWNLDAIRASPGRAGFESGSHLQ